MPYTQKNHARGRADVGAGGGSGGATAGAADVTERADAGAESRRRPKISTHMGADGLRQAPIDRIYTVRHQKRVCFRKRLRSHKCRASCARIVCRKGARMR